MANNKRDKNIKLQGIKLNEVDDFCFLGSMIKQDTHNKYDLNSSIV